MSCAQGQGQGVLSGCLRVWPLQAAHTDTQHTEVLRAPARLATAARLPSARRA